MALLAVVGSGCGGRSSVSGTGPDVDACVAYAIYNSFAEPSPRKPDEVVPYAEAMVNVVERVRPDFKIEIKDKDDLVPSKEVIAAYAQVKASAEHLRDQARAAGADRGRLLAATNALAADDAYLAADARITDFFTNECPQP